MERHKKNRKKNHKILEKEDWIIKIKNMRGGNKKLLKKRLIWKVMTLEHKSVGRTWNIWRGRKNSNKTIEWNHSSSNECKNLGYNKNIDGGVSKRVSNT